MIVDGLANVFISMTLFTIMVLSVKELELTHKKNYTPASWISVKKHGVKLFLLGIIATLFYKSLVGLIGVFNGTMVLTINKSGILNSLIFSLASSIGFLAVALFEEGLFRGYIMQVVLKKFPKLIDRKSVV